MLKKIFTGSCLIAAASVALAAAPAWAGFQWVAQPETAYQQQPAVGYATVSPAPAVSSPEIMSPVVISGSGNTASAPLTPSYNPTPYNSSPAPFATQASDAPTTILSSAPPPPAPVKPVRESLDLASATLTIPAAASSEIVRGFGSQIPLALALRQILPVGYSFSIDQSVEVDTPVSYKGGKPWRETIKDMLAPSGLAMREQGPSVSIGRVVAAAAPAPISAPAPVMSGNIPMLQPAAPSRQVAPMSLGTLRMASDMPTVNVGNGEGWSAQRGDSLHKVLSDWCRRAGIELQWHAEYDYPMEASASFNGDFEDAVRGLLAGFENARPQPIGELHANPNAGQKLLVVQARGNNYSN